MKVVFFEVHDWEKEWLEPRLPQGPTYSFYLGKLQDTKEEEWHDADVLCVFIHSSVTADVIGELPNLKFIVTRSTGYNHIALDACKARGIAVLTVPTYGENTVAEHTFALILNLSRKVHKSYVRTLQGDYRIDDLRGFDLKGKTLGVVGGGHIGLNVVKIAKGFGMHVLVYDHHPDQFLADVLHYRYVSFDEVIAQSDIISLHVPLTKGTTHLIDAGTIAKMKDGVMLVNTSRGGVVDTEALLEALRTGKVAGAGLDVIEGEELVLEEAELHKKADATQWSLLYKSQQILRMPSVVFTPHNAFNSQEALERILMTSVENVNAALARDLTNVAKNRVG